MEEQFVEFVNTTAYTKQSLGALNDLAGRTIQKANRNRNRLLFSLIGVACLAVGVYLFVTSPEKRGIATVIFLYSAVLLYLSAFSRRFMLWSSQRQLPRGVKTCTYLFGDEGITCRTEIGDRAYVYDKAEAVVENEKWYAVFFGPTTGIIIDKAGFTQGDAAAFKAFIGQHTLLPIQEVK